MNDLLSSSSLVDHGTYTPEAIEELDALKARVLHEKGLASLSHADRLRIFNYLYLTSTVTDSHLSDYFVDDIRGCFDDAFMELVRIVADGDGKGQYNPLVGYKYSLGTVCPLEIGGAFAMEPGHSLADIGCGYAQGSIAAIEAGHAPAFLVDPNAVNIRAVYAQLARKKLLGNTRIQIRLALVQHAGLPPAGFDRVYLGNTMYFMQDDETRTVLKTVLSLLKPAGVAAIIPSLSDGVLKGFPSVTHHHSVSGLIPLTLIQNPA